MVLVIVADRGWWGVVKLVLMTADIGNFKHMMLALDDCNDNMKWHDDDAERHSYTGKILTPNYWCCVSATCLNISSSRPGDLWEHILVHQNCSVATTTSHCWDRRDEWRLTARPCGWITRQHDRLCNLRLLGIYASWPFPSTLPCSAGRLDTEEMQGSLGGGAGFQFHWSGGF